MDTSSLTVGMPILAKIGRNLIRATVIKIINERTLMVRNVRTETDFTISIAKVRPDLSVPAPPAPEAPVATPKKTLLAIAYEVLEELHSPLSTMEILDIAEERGTFKPEEWGRTPSLTLYGSFVREAKKANPKVRKSEARGKWELVETEEVTSEH